jgi:beta-N-acetylhexosaminidase
MHHPIGMLGVRSGAIQNDKANELPEFFKTVPLGKRGKVVFADEAMNLRVRFAPANLFDGIDCIGGWGTAQFAIVDGKHAFAFDSGTQQGEPHFPAGLRRIFPRRNRRRHKNYLFQAKDFACFPGEDQMRMMDGIECAAVNADVSQGKKPRERFVLLPLSVIEFSVQNMKRDLLGQLILTGVPGKVLDAGSAALFRKVQPGGFILFGRNIESALQLRKLIDDLRDLSEIEPIVTIDQEGGRVSRLRLIGNEPPNAQQLRDKNDVELIRRHGDITGRLLRVFGFNLDLCPVLDLSFDDNADNSLRGRCYGKTVDQVVRNAAAFNDAMRNQGIGSCGKHFPGYTAAQSDAHYELPRIDRSREELDREELAVFRAFIGREGSLPRRRDPKNLTDASESRPCLSIVDSMMICHGWYPCLEQEKTPASLSHRIISGLLRDEMEFEGLIMTDDLDMGAILNGYSLDQTMRLAVAAGNDLVMICHRIPEIENVHRILGTLPGDQIQRAQESIARFKKKLAPPAKFSEAAFRKIDSEIWELRVATLGEERAKQRSVEDGKRSPVEMY